MSTPEPPQDSGPATPPEAPGTGEPRVDDALQRLSDLDEVDVDDHVERLSTAHAALQEVLRQPDDPQP